MDGQLPARPVARRPCATFVANRGFALTSSRTLLIQRLLSSGWQVVAATAMDDQAAQLAARGVTVERVTFHRGGLSPLQDLMAFLTLLRIYRRYRPQLIHHFHIKPVVFGGCAANWVPDAIVANNIEGLGYAFSHRGIVRCLAEVGYRFSLARSQVNIFLNLDDRRHFTDRRWIPESKAALIVSTGVDTERFRPRRTTRRAAVARVLMVTRLLWQKGVREYVEAARMLKQMRLPARFQLAGEWDPAHPDAVDQAWVQAAVREGAIEFLGYLDNVDRELPKVDVFVLPSYYREGVPRVLLEAAACGVPVITTDVPGCRETVVDRVTGRLVPPRDACALANAVAELLADPALRRAMGRHGRQRVEQEFDVRIITERYLTLYRSLGAEI